MRHNRERSVSPRALAWASSFAIVRRLARFLEHPDVLLIAEEYRVEEAQVGVDRPLNENPSVSLPPPGLLDQFLRGLGEESGGPRLALLTGFYKALQSVPCEPRMPANFRAGSFAVFARRSSIRPPSLPCCILPLRALLVTERPEALRPGPVGDEPCKVRYTYAIGHWV